MPSVPSSDPGALWRALSRLPPRSAQLLMFRFVDGRSETDCAALYGIAPEALQIQVLRAAQLLELSASREGRTRAPVLPSEVPALPREVEQHRAHALARELEAGPARPLGPWATLLQQLRERGPEIRTLAEQAAREELESPAARRKDLLRRLALAGLIALAVWLYLRHGR